MSVLQLLRDEIWEAFKLRIILSVLLLFLCSFYLSVKEMRFLLFGQTSTATVVAVIPSRNDGRPFVQVNYEFTDPELKIVRKESDSVAPNFAIPFVTAAPAPQVVQIEFIAGSAELSRLTGNTRRFWLIPFGVMLSVVCGLFLRITLDYYALERKKAARR